MQSYISHPRGTVFYHLIKFLSSKSCPIHLLRKISEIIENMIFSLILVLQEIWYFCQLPKIKRIWYLRWTFSLKCCFSCKHFLLCKWSLWIYLYSLQHLGGLSGSGWIFVNEYFFPYCLCQKANQNFLNTAFFSVLLIWCDFYIHKCLSFSCKTFKNWLSIL